MLSVIPCSRFELLQGTLNYLEVGTILQECRSILGVHPDISISFVKKQVNKVIHLLAMMPFEINCFNDFPSPSYFVLETLMYDTLLININALF